MKPVSALALFALLPAPALAQTHELNPPLARGITGELDEVEYSSPDGKHVLCFTDADRNNVDELRSAPLSGSGETVLLKDRTSRFEPWAFDPATERLVVADGGRLVRLSLDGRERVPLTPSLPDFSWVGAIGIAGERAVYSLFADGRDELFSVPIAGDTAPVRLSTASAERRDLISWLVASDGRSVVYRDDPEGDGGHGLFVVPADGSASARALPIPLVAGGAVSLVFDVAVEHVVYVADQVVDEQYELFSIAIDGLTAPRRLSGPMVEGGDVGNRPGGWLNGVAFRLAPDRRRVVFDADARVDERFELWSVPVDGSEAAVVLASPPQWESRNFLVFAPDSTQLVFSGDASGSGADELFVVPLDGSTPPRLVSTPMPVGGSVLSASFSPDSRWIAYLADQEVDERLELWSVPLDASRPPSRLSPPLQPDGDVVGFEATPDGVLYLADLTRDGVIELHLVPIEGGAARRLAEGSVDSFRWSDTAQHAQVLFTRQESLFAVRTSPGRPEVDLEVLEATAVGDVQSFELVPDGSRAVYRAEQRSRATELFSVATGGRREAVPLNGDFAAIVGVRAAWLEPDGAHVVFRVGDTAPELHRAPVDGSAAPVIVSDRPDGASVSYAPPAISLPAGRVAFTTSGFSVLYSAPLDASAPAVQLSPIDADVTVGEPLFVSADGSRIGFLLGERLFSAPLDGSAPAVRVSAGGQVGIPPDFALTPDGARAVYRTPVGSFARAEVFSAPSDGSASPVRLSGDVPLNRGAVDLALSADGRWAAYRSDAAADDVLELFAAPSDGSAPARRLHPPLVAGGDVLTLTIAPDASLVLFTADLLADERVELFVAPPDGSRPAVRVNPDLVAGGNVLDFAIAPDSASVLYRADQERDGLVELYRASLRGALPLVKLGTAVTTYRISADSSTVVFAAVDAAGSSSLLLAPLSGEAGARAVGGPFQPGVLRDFAVSADGSVVAWRADADEPDVIELYAARSPGGKGH